jgi:predicted nucleic acid binding AN1-type Zn finger protein
VRKRSDSNKFSFCAKAERQQQVFFLCESRAAATGFLSVRKQSDSNKFSFCAKAKRQQQVFFLCESRAAATTHD